MNHDHIYINNEDKNNDNKIINYSGCERVRKTGTRTVAV